MKKGKVITISREFGSGGREIAYRLSERLKIPYYDNELLSIAAEDSNISEDVFNANDESITDQMRMASDEYYHIDPVSEQYEFPVSDQIFMIQTAVIKRLAQKGPCILVGRCSDMIVEDAFHVFICSDMKSRVKHLMEIDEDKTITKKQMEARVRAMDKRRREYYQYYTGNEWGRPKNYHLCLNSGKLGIDKCVDIIVASVSLK